MAGVLITHHDPSFCAWGHDRAEERWWVLRTDRAERVSVVEEKTDN
jgi:hypothetical protein